MGSWPLVVGMKLAGRWPRAVRRGVRVVLAGLGMGLAIVLGGVGSAQADGPIRILILGDSLTAGYGLPREATFPHQLEALLREQGIDATVINAGVSGDTTAGGLARLDWSLADDPDIVVVALGGNDGLRGIDPAATRANLDAILHKLTDAGVEVLLAGMYAPRNLGREYEQAFDRIYPELAEAYGVTLYPFILEGVALDPALSQEDGMHPNAAGMHVIAERLVPYLTPLIRRAAGGTASAPAE